MVYWLDYSAAKLSGQTIKDAGYSGVIRYIDSPAKPYGLKAKHTDKAEYDSHRAAGLSVLLVMQTTTSASDGGFAAGQDHARRALAGADYLGYAGPIFFTNDRTTVPNPAAWRAYLDGAANVLGAARVGAYGFRNAMDLAVGHATFFWQAGRRSDVAGHVHAWQDNNTQVKVGGVLCDRNLILKTIEEDDMPTAKEVADAVWSMPGWHPDVAGGIKMGDQLAYTNHFANMIPGVLAAVTAIATDQDITPEQLAAAVDKAVATHTPTAAQTAAALLPLVEGIAERVLGVDNKALAEEFLRQLREALPSTPEGTSK